MYDLERILKFLNLGKKEFSKIIGVVPSAISKVISRKMDLPKIWIEYLEENYNINVEDFKINTANEPQSEYRLRSEVKQISFDEFMEVPVVIVSHEGIVCKQITGHDIDTGAITCHSWNPIFEDYTINLEDVIQIFYVKKVVERRIRF